MPIVIYFQSFIVYLRKNFKCVQILKGQCRSDVMRHDMRRDTTQHTHDLSQCCAAIFKKVSSLDA